MKDHPFDTYVNDLFDIAATANHRARVLKTERLACQLIDPMVRDKVYWANKRGLVLPFLLGLFVGLMLANLIVVVT